MSGGSFGYVYLRVEEFVKDLEYAIETEELKLKGETKVELRDVIKQANYVAGLMKAVEWMYSCDISEDEFMEYVHALQKEFVKTTEEYYYDKLWSSRPVGVEVIDRMMLRLKTNSSKSLEKVIYENDDFGFQKYVPNTTKPKAIIVDIDGTIAHKGDRSPYDWKRVGEDEPDEVIRDLMYAMIDHFRSCDNDAEDVDIIYVSGRDSVCRQETIDWLNLHNFPDGMLYMRPENDARKDSIVKYELFDKNIRNDYNVLFVLDDRLSVCQMWRDIGLKCLQVAEGNF